MNNWILAILIFDIISFFGYGTTCIFTNKMRLEFNRYGLSQFRVLVGVGQLASSLGLLYGFYDARFFFLSSLSLASMMAAGVLVRLKIKDKLFFIFPAFFYLVLNAYLVFYFYNTVL
jgi:hypothetical protein